MNQKTSQHKWLKILFFAFLVKPIVLIGLGLNLVGRKHLTKKGPAVLVANHTSHLDTLVLMSLFPLKQISWVRPVAAADYFLKNKWIAWFSIHCLDIIPIERQQRKSKDELLAQSIQALHEGYILILFPEGTRALTEKRKYQLKRGIHYLIEQVPQATVTPILLRGLGKALPKGEALFVPFNCDVIIDEALNFNPSSDHYLKNLEERFYYLEKKCITQ